LEWDNTPGNVDTIWLGSNLTPDEITLRRSGVDLILGIAGASDTLKVKYFFSDEWHEVEQIQFMASPL
jgi:hypothetical protein